MVTNINKLNCEIQYIPSNSYITFIQFNVKKDLKGLRRKTHQVVVR